ncbi:hypothetical protein LIA77_02781 [Sarocladium implicatum]|nr:hypothetical protein LIA77_02781 [Sarocladium implicatum]
MDGPDGGDSCGAVIISISGRARQRLYPSSSVLLHTATRQGSNAELTHEAESTLGHHHDFSLTLSVWTIPSPLLQAHSTACSSSSALSLTGLALQPSAHSPASPAHPRARSSSTPTCQSPPQPGFLDPFPTATCAQSFTAVPLVLSSILSAGTLQRHAAAARHGKGPPQKCSTRDTITRVLPRKAETFVLCIMTPALCPYLDPCAVRCSVETHPADRRIVLSTDGSMQRTSRWVGTQLRTALYGSLRAYDWAAMRHLACPAATLIYYSF